MFFLATRNRPQHLAAVIESCRAVGDVPNVAVIHDGCEIYDIDWPDNWLRYRSAEHLEMAGAFRVLYAKLPGLLWYGYLNDHCHPLKPGWSAALVETAGRWGIASAVDTVQRTNPRTGRARINCYVLGGDLVRELGWVWPDFVVHLWGDDALEDIGYELGIMRHDERARMENRTLRDGSLHPDDNSRRTWRGLHYPRHDAQAYTQWKRGRFHALCDLLRRRIVSESRRPIGSPTMAQGGRKAAP